MKYSVNKKDSILLDMPGRYINVFIGEGKLTSDHMTVGLTEVHPRTEMTPHVHNDGEEIIYVIEGYGEAIVGDSIEKLEANTAVVFPIGIEHKIINKSDETLKFVFMFSPPHSFANVK